MFKHMKSEIAPIDFNKSPEMKMIRTPHAEVTEFLPPFLKKIIRESQRGEDIGTATGKATNVVDELMKYVVDQGIAREQKFDGEVARGVDILNRAAFST